MKNKLRTRANGLPYKLWNWVSVTIYRRFHSQTSYIRAGSRVKPQFLSAMNAACDSNSNVTYLVSYWPPSTVEEGDFGIFVLITCLWLAIVPKMCPDNHRHSKSQVFTAGRKKMSQWFCGRAPSTCSKSYLNDVLRKYSKNWLPRTSINSNLTP